MWPRSLSCSRSATCSAGMSARCGSWTRTPTCCAARRSGNGRRPASTASARPRERPRLCEALAYRVAYGTPAGVSGFRTSPPSRTSTGKRPPLPAACASDLRFRWCGRAQWSGCSSSSAVRRRRLTRRSCGCSAPLGASLASSWGSSRSSPRSRPPSGNCASWSTPHSTASSRATRLAGLSTGTHRRNRSSAGLARRWLAARSQRSSSRKRCATNTAEACPTITPPGKAPSSTPASNSTRCIVAVTPSPSNWPSRWFSHDRRTTGLADGRSSGRVPRGSRCSAPSSATSANAAARRRPCERRRKTRRRTPRRGPSSSR